MTDIDKARRVEKRIDAILEGIGSAFSLAVLGFAAYGAYHAIWGVDEGVHIDDKMQASAKAGQVTAAQNCQELSELQLELNRYYTKQAEGEVLPSRFEISVEDCQKMLKPVKPGYPLKPL